ncbi:MAG: futalosine hydrolase [Thermodesulforhabdaceae bacterium]
MNSKLKPFAWVLASIKSELKPLIESKQGEVYPFHGQQLWKLECSKGRIILLATTGIGKANASFTVGALAEKSDYPEIIINVGIAGCYDSTPVSIGDVVIVTECIMGDEGVWHEKDYMSSYDAIGISPLESIDDALYGRIALKFEKVVKLLPSGIHYQERVLQDKTERLDLREEPARAFRVWYGSSCSVGLASGSPEVALFRQKTYGAWIEEMEVSAIALAALRMGIPIVAIRGVSNRVGERDKSLWQMDRAISNACSCVIKILQSGLTDDGLE